MRFSSAAAATALIAASGAAAQLPSAVQSIVARLSPQCQQTVFGLITSPVVDCLNIPQTIQVISQFAQSTPNASLILPLDQLLAIDCSSSGCSNATLSSLAGNLTQGCSAELAEYDISAANVTWAVAQYPLAREIACLRTTNVTSVEGANSTSANTTASANSTYSTENGTVFCATSLLSTLADKVDANLTIPFFMDLYKSYQNNTLASEYGSLFNVTDLCDECIFAAADLLGVAYPAVGNVTLSTFGIKNNETIASFLDGTCEAEGLQWTSNGTLPEGIVLGANGSTFGFELETDNGTYTPEEPAQPIARRNVADIKARWIGQI